jgi:hypothetical protein
MVAPIASVAAAKRTVGFTPNRVKINPAGSASKNPIIENIDIRDPISPTTRPNTFPSAASVVIMGGSLNMFSVAASDAR